MGNFSWFMSESVDTDLITSHVVTLQSDVHVIYAGSNYKLKLVYKRSELILDVLFLEPFLLESSSCVILHFILLGSDQVCHSS